MFTDIDDLIAKHVAHLFIRDPVSLFSEKINQDDETDTDHFEVSYLPSYAELVTTVCSGFDYKIDHHKQQKRGQQKRGPAKEGPSKRGAVV